MFSDFYNDGYEGFRPTLHGIDPGEYETWEKFDELSGDYYLHPPAAVNKSVWQTTKEKLEANPGWYILGATVAGAAVGGTVVSMVTRGLKNVSTAAGNARQTVEETLDLNSSIRRRRRRPAARRRRTIRYH